MKIPEVGDLFYFLPPVLNANLNLVGGRIYLITDVDRVNSVYTVFPNCWDVDYSPRIYCCDSEICDTFKVVEN